MATYWENSCSFGLRYVSWCGYLIVGLVFSHLGFWSGNLFLIAPFPDLCLLVPFCRALPPARFQNRSFSIFKGFAVYSHGSHLGHVTLTMYLNFHSSIPRILHVKFGFDWSSGY